MAELHGILTRRETSQCGVQADMLLVEPNGDRHPVHCFLHDAGTEVSGDGEVLAYLNERYGPKTVCFVARDTAGKLPF